MLNDVPLGTKLTVYTTALRKTPEGRLTYEVVGNFEKVDDLGVRLYDGVTAVVIPWHTINSIEWSEV